MSKVMTPELLLNSLREMELTKPKFHADLEINKDFRASVETDEQSGEVALYVYSKKYESRSPDGSAHFSINMGEENEFDKPEYHTRFHSSISRYSNSGSAKDQKCIDHILERVAIERAIQDLLITFMSHMLSIKEKMFDAHMTGHVTPWREMVAKQRAKQETLRLEVEEKKKGYRKVEESEAVEQFETAKTEAMEKGVSTPITVTRIMETEVIEIVLRVQVNGDSTEVIWERFKFDEWREVRAEQVLNTMKVGWVKKTV
ncbi:hypothetical protein [Vibrio crassostreae]|uniref:hypothetical protein n=1 Tax=Vibrio crassostreae TaxID=246167 RepID=UPI001B304B0C|nr:hypothetical protein [Vibrio crassostreae]